MCARGELLRIEPIVDTLYLPAEVPHEPNVQLSGHHDPKLTAFIDAGLIYASGLTFSAKGPDDKGLTEVAVSFAPDKECDALFGRRYRSTSSRKSIPGARFDGAPYTLPLSRTPQPVNAELREYVLFQQPYGLSELDIPAHVPFLRQVGHVCLSDTLSVTSVVNGKVYVLFEGIVGDLLALYTRECEGLERYYDGLIKEKYRSASFMPRPKHRTRPPDDRFTRLLLNVKGDIDLTAPLHRPLAR